MTSGGRKGGRRLLEAWYFQSRNYMYAKAGAIADRQMHKGCLKPGNTCTQKDIYSLASRTSFMYLSGGMIHATALAVIEGLGTRLHRQKMASHSDRQQASVAVNS